MNLISLLQVFAIIAGILFVGFFIALAMLDGFLKTDGVTTNSPIDSPIKETRETAWHNAIREMREHLANHPDSNDYYSEGVPAIIGRRKLK
jgi:hypothetical protein